MAKTKSLRGADCKLYLGGKLYNEVQSISLIIDFGEQEIWGIDSPFPQEIAPTHISVQGSVTGVQIKGLGGLQAYGITSKIEDILYAPYLSFRVNNRANDEDIIFIKHIKVSQEQIQIMTKGVVKVSFNFKGIIPLFPLDMS